MEEFGIHLEDIIPIGALEGLTEKHGVPMLYLCENFTGEPRPDGTEMTTAEFMKPADVFALVKEGKAFEPFAKSLEMLMEELI